MLSEPNWALALSLDGLDDPDVLLLRRLAGSAAKSATNPHEPAVQDVLAGSKDGRLGARENGCSVTSRRSVSHAQIASLPPCQPHLPI